MRASRIGVVLAVCGLVSASAVGAESPVNATLSMHDNLAALAAGKKVVTVLLQNGTSYRARIGAVGDHHVVLTEPAQKEFFDVLVPIAAISALEVRAREQ